MLTGGTLGPACPNDYVALLPQYGQMTQANSLTMTIVAGNFLFTNAASGCLVAAFYCDDEFTVSCLPGSKHINLGNIQGKTNCGWVRYGHRFYSVYENVFHSTSSPYLGVPPIPKEPLFGKRSVSKGIVSKMRTDCAFRHQSVEKVEKCNYVGYVKFLGCAIYAPPRLTVLDLLRNIKTPIYFLQCNRKGNYQTISM